MTVTLHLGDCIEVMRTMADNSVDSICTDPPYELGFMGKKWDSSGIANSVVMWSEALRVLKPGGHLLAFSGSRTYHRMVCAIEDAGFEVRDQIMWVYGSGFPKSLDVSKAIDKAAGAERDVTRAGQTKATELAGKFDMVTSSERERRDSPATDAAQQWQGWGTALKPAHEPICVARKPLIGTVAANVLAHGTGALNIDACRIEGNGNKTFNRDAGDRDREQYRTGTTVGAAIPSTLGRWPANLIHDGSDEVLAAFPQANHKTGGPAKTSIGGNGAYSGGVAHVPVGYDDTGSAARFFYCAKASKKDRNEGLIAPGPQFAHGATLRNIENTATVGNTHPTVKPTALMAYLCRLVTPPGGVVLDQFMGSGSTGKAAVLEGFNFIGIDMTPEYVEIARARIEFARLSLTVAANDPSPAPMEAANDPVSAAVVQSDMFAGMGK